MRPDSRDEDHPRRGRDDEFAPSAEILISVNGERLSNEEPGAPRQRRKEPRRPRGEGARAGWVARA
jgi:hypothetical protein